MKSKFLGLAVLLSLAAPTALHAQWYGWDHGCASGSLELCASVQVQTVPTGTGATWISVLVEPNALTVLGGPVALLFSSTLEVPQGVPGWGPWYGPPYPALWLENWSGNYFAPFTVKTTDLIGYYSEAYSRADVEAGGPTATYDLWLSDPQWIVPEPGAIILFGTGLIGVLGAAWRRKQHDA